MDLFIVDARCKAAKPLGFELTLYGRDDQSRVVQVIVPVPSLPILLQSAKPAESVKRRVCSLVEIYAEVPDDLGRLKPNPKYTEIQATTIYKRLLFGHLPDEHDPTVAKHVPVVELRTANAFTWRALKKAADRALHERPLRHIRPVESFKSEAEICLLQMDIQCGAWVHCDGNYARPVDGVRVFRATNPEAVRIVDKASVPTLRAGSFDLECSTMLPRTDGTWSVACNPDEHPIISIGLAVCDLINGDEASNWQRHFFYWSPNIAGAAELGGGNESNIANTMRAQEAAAIERGDFVKHAAEEVPIVIHACASERAMLAVFANQTRKLRLDWFISYNGESFDIPYMATRIRKCFSEGDRKLAWSYGRDEGETRPPRRAGAPPTPEDIKKATAAKLAGRIVLEPTAFDTIGFASLDCLKFTQSLNLESAKLSEVSSHLFGADDSKVDLSYEEMMQAAYEDTAEGWGAIMVYNLRDSLMPIRILAAKKQFAFSLQLSRVSGCALPAITAGGQSKRLLAMVQREAKVRDMVINEPTKLDFPDAPWLHGGGTKVKGALVLDIEPGYYSDPVAVTDFSSLYPSIILSRNLSFETFLASHNCTQPELGDDVPPSLKEVTRVFHVEERDESTDVVSLTWHYPILQKGPNNEREGLYPFIVRKLLDERKAAKREMKKHTPGSAEHVILDARQNALKVLCNSAYGILNAVLKGRLYCRPLGGIVTCEGRNAIRTIVGVVQRLPNCKVVAGDTDSAMFLLQGRTVAQAFEVGERVAVDVNKALHADGALSMNLELEKVMTRAVFVQKKCYSYLKLEEPDGKPKHVSMGLLSKKRGTAQLLKDAFIACEQAYLIPHEFDERDVRLLQLRILRELMRALADEVEETQFIRTSFLHHQYRAEFNGAHVVATRRWCEETGAPWPGGSRIKTLLAKPSQLVKAANYKAYMYTYTYDHFTQQGLQLDLSRYVRNVAGRFEALLRFTIPDVAQRFKKAVDLLAHTGSQKRLTFQGAPSPVPPRITKPINKMTVQELRNAIDEIDPCIGDVVGAHLFTNTNEAPSRVIAPPPSHTPPISSYKMAGPWALLMAKPAMNEEEERRKRQKKVDSGVCEAVGGSGFCFDALQ